MISTGTLSKLRRVYERSMIDLCTMYAPPVATASDRGQEPDSDYPADWTVIESGVKCRFNPSQRTPVERSVGGQVQSVNIFSLAKPASTVRPESSYRIRITHQSGVKLTTPREFEIVAVRDRSYNIAWNIDVIEVK